MKSLEWDDVKCASFLPARIALCLAVSCGGGEGSGGTDSDTGGTGSGGDANGGGSGDANGGGSGDANGGGSSETDDPDGPVGSEDGLICNHEHFCWENPLPQGNTLNAVWVGSSDSIWTAGNAGMLLHYDGARWSNQVALDAPELIDSTVTLAALWGSAEDDLWIGGWREPTGAETSVLLRWNGAELSAVPHPSSPGIRHIVGSDSDNVWAVTTSQSLMRFDGTSWQEVPCSTCTPLAVWANAPDDAWAVGFSNNVKHWDGNEWLDTPGDHGGAHLAVWGSGSDDVWTAGTSGRINHWNGVEWEPIDSATTEDLGWIWGTGPDDVWAVGRNGVVVRNQGSGFATVATPRDHDFFGVSVLPGAGPWAVGAAGHISRWDGSSFVEMSSGPTPIAIQAVGGSGPADVWFGTTEGLLHWDATATVTSVTDGPEWSVRSLLRLSRDELWVAGEGSAYLAAGVWTPTANQNFSAIWGNDLESVFGVGQGTAGEDSHGLRHWDGTTWTVLHAFDGLSIHGSNGNDIRAVGINGSTLRFDGAEWDTEDSGTTRHLWDVCVLSAEEAWAVGDAGTVLRTTGGVWTPDPAATEERLEGIFCFGSDDIWAVGQGGVVLHHDGEAWRALDSGTDGALLDVWASGPSDLWIVGSNGAVLHKRR